MLVVSRKKEESIIINGNIQIKILASSKDKVSIGIEAPREISVVRAELLDTIRENQASATSEDTDHTEIKGATAQNFASMIKEKKSHNERKSNF